ncbi:MAG: hypothetical protein KF803_02930 [Cyclobacteriaceae bacterium]|nr:hypothetical protein [Cyclobacteriaceae bacterium]
MALQNESESLLYASTSANLFNFLGDTNVEEHYRLYKEVIEMAYRAHQDLLSFEVDNLVIVDPHNVLSMLKTDKAPIFVTLHTGSFNMLIAYLLKNGFIFYALSDTESLEITDYHNVTHQYNQRYNNNGDFAKINIEVPGSIFRVIKKIKEGFPTMAFLDGNKGIGGQVKSNENLLNIDFLKGKVRVRKGLATLSCLTHRPLVFALSYLKGNRSFLEFYHPFECKGSDAEAFANETIQTIFKYFETHVKQFPSQWCNWPYVHNWSDLSVFYSKSTPLETLVKSSSLHFNEKRFCPIKYNGGYFLFDRIRYKVIPVDPNLAPIFSHKTTPQQRRELIQQVIKENNPAIKDFIQSEVLI